MYIPKSYYSSEIIHKNRCKMYWWMLITTFIIGLLGYAISTFFHFGLTGTGCFLIGAGIIDYVAYYYSDKFIIKSEIVTNSLKFLLSYNLISVSYNETGIYYKSNDMSQYFVDLLKSLYKSKIIKQVLWLENNYSNYSDIELENLITNVLNSKSPTFIQYGLIDKEHFKYAK